MIEANRKLKDFMEEAGFSGVGLAKAVGVSPSYISQIVRRRRTLSAPTAKRICEVLGCTFKDIFQHPLVYKTRKEQEQERRKRLDNDYPKS